MISNTYVLYQVNQLKGNVRAGQKVTIFYHFNSLRLDVYVLITFALQVMHLGDCFFSLSLNEKSSPSTENR